MSLATLFVASTATASFAAGAEEGGAGGSGHYIVVMKSDPLATYTGGVDGLAGTKPAQGQQLDATSEQSQEYRKRLVSAQEELARQVGVSPDHTYQAVVNGFSATLTGDQVAQLQASDQVAEVYPDEVTHPRSATPKPASGGEFSQPVAGAVAVPTPQPSGSPAPSAEPSDAPSPQPSDTPSPQPSDAPSPLPTDAPSPQPTDAPSPQPLPALDVPSGTQFLGLGDDETGMGGVWEQTGGVETAGEGVVIGVIDSGISPENPSFAGKPLKTKEASGPKKKFSGKAPYTDGTTVYYDKADGGQFHARMVEGSEWDKSFYSTKLIGAQYFADGAKAQGFDFALGDYESPRDNLGHGTHTASTAAGDVRVPVSVNGVDYGTITGVAPGAKVAAYKVCYKNSKDSSCAASDELAAVDQAVADGVDVINLSLGVVSGGAPELATPLDLAFLNAAAAGVFVSTAAGNEGPDASTTDHASPWYATVAASTLPLMGATVQFGGSSRAGITETLGDGASVTGPAIWAGDAAVADIEAAETCKTGTLDPLKVAGHIVICAESALENRQLSETVAEAGGVGMVLLGLSKVVSDLPLDGSALPSVGLVAGDRDAVLEYVRGGVNRPMTLVGGNTTGVETPTPRIPDFSNRGPVLVGGSDVLKPDITAPGSEILAASNNAPGADPVFALKSGTSMAAPHIAGLGALYLGERPKASPAEILSAMMTTASDTLHRDGSINTDPFEQGAGLVDPTRFFHPGLLYLSDTEDWMAFMKGKGLASTAGVEPIDGSDLNLASISIGSLVGSQTVTRTVTSTEAGTFTASADVPGVDVTIEPSTLSFDAPGEEKSFTVTFSRNTAPLEQWATGSLTWKSATNTARSPIAVRPVTVSAPAAVTGTGATGTLPVKLTSGVSGDLTLGVSGLAASTLLRDPAHPVAGHSGDEKSGGEERHAEFVMAVPEGATFARFVLDSSDDTGSNLDLVVIRLAADGKTPAEKWITATDAADEQLSIPAPTAGTYVVRVALTSTSAPMTWDLSSAVVTPQGEGALTATPNPIPALQGRAADYDLSWSGLRAGTRYVGYVTYGDATDGTLVTVDAK